MSHVVAILRRSSARKVTFGHAADALLLRYVIQQHRQLPTLGQSHIHCCNVYTANSQRVAQVLRSHVSQATVPRRTLRPTVLASVLGCAALMCLARRRRSDLPPGPKGYPIVGNIFDVPSTHAWVRFSELNWMNNMAHHIPSTLAKTYVHGFVHAGEITHLNVMGQEMELSTLPKLPSACLKETGHLFRPSRGDGAWRIIERKGVLPLTHCGPQFPRIQEELKQVDQDASKCREIFSITGKGYCAVRGEGYG